MDKVCVHDSKTLLKAMDPLDLVNVNRRESTAADMLWARRSHPAIVLVAGTLQKQSPSHREGSKMLARKKMSPTTVTASKTVTTVAPAAETAEKPASKPPKAAFGKAFTSAACQTPI